LQVDIRILAQLTAKSTSFIIEDSKVTNKGVPQGALFRVFAVLQDWLMLNANIGCAEQTGSDFTCIKVNLDPSLQ
jgi:hypothetical protein